MATAIFLSAYFISQAIRQTYQDDNLALGLIIGLFIVYDVMKLFRRR